MTLTIARTEDELAELTRGALQVEKEQVRIVARDLLAGRMDALAATAVFGPGAVRDRARWIIAAAAHDAGNRTSSIHGLYMARARGEVREAFTVPALNLRGPTYDEARAAFRAANKLRVGAMVFELARSEIGYTDQRPAEYAACIQAAALRERYLGPLFLQGDHYQVSPSKYAKDPEQELRSLEALIEESLAAGYRNIDIDASTMVTLEPEDLRAQQRLNGGITARLARSIRAREPGIPVSIGGEIGEVGKHNSKPEELEAFWQEFQASFGEGTGLSKISVNTGSSHGGVVGPDGKVVKVAIDFEALRTLGQAARKHGMGGAVQHGASTLPEESFHHFPEVQCLEIHLATGFQNLVFDHPALPEGLRARMEAWTREHCADERKAGDTDEQFLYKSRKKSTGPFKRELWGLEEEAKKRIFLDLENRFALLFEKLRVGSTRITAERYALQERSPPRPAGAPLAKDAGMAKHEGE
jgi:fructose/tagatose bisphosphate aldolase